MEISEFLKDVSYPEQEVERGTYWIGLDLIQLKEDWLIVNLISN